MKRIFLFLLTNLAVVLVLSIVARLTGLDAWLAAHGQSYTGLLVFAALFGFGGSFISLLMSKTMAKRAMGVQRDRSADHRSDRALAARRGGAPRAHRGPGDAGSRHLPAARARTPLPPAGTATPPWSR